MDAQLSGDIGELVTTPPAPSSPGQLVLTVSGRAVREAAAAAIRDELASVAKSLAEGH